MCFNFMSDRVIQLHVLVLAIVSGDQSFYVDSFSSFYISTLSLPEIFRSKLCVRNFYCGAYMCSLKTGMVAKYYQVSVNFWTQAKFQM